MQSNRKPFYAFFLRSFLGLTISFATVVFCSANRAATPDDLQSVTALKSQLDELNGTMSELREKINAGEGNLNQTQDDYADALEEANEVIDKLLSAALDAIEKDPTDQGNIRTAMGILLNEAEAENDLKVLKACDRLIKAGVNKAYFDYAARAPRISLKAREIFDEVLIRQVEFKADDLPRVLLTTNKGDITVELYENEAPETVGNFIALVESGFYKNSLFHRVIDNFVAQVGGPKKGSEGVDDPGYKIYDECKRPDTRPHFSAVVSMAKTSMPDSGSSQFYITLNRTSHLDGLHTVFGRVIDGHDIVDRIARTEIEINGEATDVPNSNPDYIVSAKVLRKRDHVYKPRKVGEAKETEEVEMPPASPESKPFLKDEDSAAEEKAVEEKSEEEDSAADATEDSAADDSATEDSATEDSATEDADDSATEEASEDTAGDTTMEENPEKVDTAAPDEADEEDLESTE